MFCLKIRRFCLLAGLTALAVPTVAQEFSELERRLHEHPSLQQLNFEALANREQAAAATALPDPELSLGVNNVPIANPSFDRFLPSNKAVGIVQMLPNRAGREARRAKMLGNARQIDALTSARFSELRGLLLVDLIALNRIAEQRELAHASNGKYNELTEVVEAEINAGRPALFRLAEIERERAEVVRTLVVLQGEAARIQASIAEKVGSVEQTHLPAITLKNWNQDPQQFHAVRVAAAGTAIADEGIREAQASWKTNWGVHLTYQQRSSGRGGPDSSFSGDDWFSAGVSFSVPVWGKRKQAHTVRAAQAQRSSARANVRSIALRSVARFESLQAELAVARASKQVLLDKIEAIRAEILAQQTNYESGAGDYAPVIDGELAILSLQAQIADEESRALSSIVLSNALLVMP